MPDAAPPPAADDVDAVELVTFSSGRDDAYVYAPLPPATSYGHRAETWNPDKWLTEVKIRVLTAGDSCFVRMLLKDTGELFAECPLPSDGTPLPTVVEPVVDSSRFFVLKVVDRESGNHAWLGIGFRSREDASDFTAALDEYRQYLRRKREAEQLRQEFEQLQAAGAAAAAAGGDGKQQQQQQQQHGGGRDLSLQPGQTIHINLKAASQKRASAGKAAAVGADGGGSSSSSSSSGFFRLQPSPPAGGAAPLLPPPPGAAAAPGGDTSSAGAKLAAWPSKSAAAPGGGGDDGNSSAGAPQPTGAAGADEEDEWGDFASAS